jgi:hypothetical protein
MTDKTNIVPFRKRNGGSPPVGPTVVDTILDTLAPFTEEEAARVIIETVAARFDGTSLARIATELSELYAQLGRAQ